LAGLPTAEMLGRVAAGLWHTGESRGEREGRERERERERVQSGEVNGV